MRGIHKLEDFDLVLGVLNNKTDYAPVAVKRVEAIVDKLDSVYRKLDELDAKRRTLLNDASILEDKLIDACSVAKSEREPATRTKIISFTPGLKDALLRAQKLANEKQTAYGVWEHVGRFGYPDGDIPARHTFKVEDLNKMDPDTAQWALVGCVDPEGV